MWTPAKTSIQKCNRLLADMYYKMENRDHSLDILHYWENKPELVGKTPAVQQSHLHTIADSTKIQAELKHQPLLGWCTGDFLASKSNGMSKATTSKS